MVAMLLLAGAYLTARARSWPMYTAPDAPDRLAARLAGIADLDTRTLDWITQLPAFETPRKHYFDFGCGLAGFAAGLLFSARALAEYLSAMPRQRPRVFRLAWMLSFLLPLAGDLWGYPLRYLRGDFPPWNDSLADFLSFDLVRMTFLWFLTSMMLTLFLHRREFPPALRLIRPADAFGWFRLGILLAWQGLLLGWVLLNVVVGDAGQVAGAMIQISLLALVIAAARRLPPPPLPAAAL